MHRINRVARLICATLSIYRRRLHGTIVDAGTGATTTVTGTTRNKVSVGALGQSSVMRSPSTGTFVPAARAGWRVALPGTRPRHRMSAAAEATSDVANTQLVRLRQGIRELSEFGLERFLLAT